MRQLNRMKIQTRTSTGPLMTFKKKKSKDVAQNTKREAPRQVILRKSVTTGVIMTSQIHPGMIVALT